MHDALSDFVMDGVDAGQCSTRDCQETGGKRG